jgi:hypothetical protein
MSTTARVRRSFIEQPAAGYGVEQEGQPGEKNQRRRVEIIGR